MDLNGQHIWGIQESDYPSEDTNWKRLCRGGGYMKDLPSDISEQEQFGAVQWVLIFIQFDDYLNYF